MSAQSLWLLPETLLVERLGLAFPIASYDFDDTAVLDFHLDEASNR